MQPSPSSFERTLNAALQSALDYLASLPDGGVAATAGRDDLLRRINVPLEDSGADSTRVIEDLVRGAEGGLLRSAGPRFFGWVIGGSSPAALAADWLTSAWDQNAGLYACSPAASVVEEVAGEWLKDLLHLPSTASFALVTGCQMAHATCLAAARHALLRSRSWDVEADGLAGAPPIRILTSTERHATLLRAARLLGLGERCIQALPTDNNGCMQPDLLRAELQQSPEQPTIVVLQAGDLNMGAYDAFEELIPVAKQFNAWVHVDGAFGLWAAAAPRLRHLLRGCEHADSWATDGHKWLNVPYDSGYAFVADEAAHRAAFSMTASYVAQSSGARDQLNFTPEWSRRARGFSTYAAIRELGRNGVASLMERCCDLTRHLVGGIGSLPGATVLRDGEINQGMVSFIPSGSSPSQEQCDVFTDQVIAAIAATGEAFFTGTTWRGRRAMRISVCNWQTTETDVDRVVAAVREVLSGLRG